MSLDILAFFAHPDDETMLCGGTLALLAKQGARIHLLIATRGEGGEMGEPPVCAREALGRVREDELRCAAQALGAASLTLMNYIDPTVGEGDELYPFTEDLDAVTAQIVEAAHFWKAGALITHGVNGEYGHPAHILAHQAARAAVGELGSDSILFYTAQGSFEDHPFPRLSNLDAPAQIILDVTSVLEEKTRAAMCHRTQHALFIRYWSEEAGRTLTVPEVILNIESLHRVSPVNEGQGEIHDELADLLWSSGFARLPVRE